MKNNIERNLKMKDISMRGSLWLEPVLRFAHAFAPFVVIAH